MKPLIEIINTDNEPNIIERIMNNKLSIGDKVLATITKNGYFQNEYKGTVVGFTINNRAKVESYRGVKCHALHNVKRIK